jgi:hypothetical protein
MDSIKKSRKPKVNPEKAIIYIFKTPDSKENSLYKIGRTKDLTKRLQFTSIRFIRRYRNII